MKAFILAMVIFLTFISAKQAKAQGLLRTDSSKVEIRSPKTSLSELKKEKEYHYGSEITNPVSSWWEQLKGKFRKIYDDFFNNEGYGSYRRFAFYLFLMLGLAYFVMKFFGLSLISPFQRKDADFDLSYYSEKETIHGRNFRKEAEAAIQRNEYKLAVRLYYLGTLKQLSEKGLINWQPNKTNRSYYYELKPGLKKEFEKLTEVFEYCWYGNFEIKKSDFEEIKSQFEQFNS